MTLPPELPIPMSDARHATADELLAHAGWIRTLALSLCRDTWMADDVVQETWLAALRRPPLSDRPLKPWLARVLKNFANERRRQVARRAQHELVDDPVGAEIGAAAIEESETRAQLVEAVLELREPYRSVVMLRYWGQLEPQAIAQRQGIPSATVRTRLRRGLGELRERLEREAGGDAQTAFLAVAAVARLDPSKPLGAAALPTIGGAAALATTGWSARLAIGLAAILLAFCGYVLAVDPFGLGEGPAIATPAVHASLDDEPLARPSVAPKRREPESAGSDQLGARGARRDRGPARPEATADEALEPGPNRIVGRVLEGDRPLPGLEVFLAPGQRVRFALEPGELPDLLTTTMTDAEGRFRFDALEEGRYVVAVERAGRFRHAGVVLDGRSEPARTFVYGDCTIHGTVWDAYGEPVPRALIRFRRPGLDPDADAYQLWTEAGPDGSFSQVGLTAGDWMVSAKIDLDVGDDWRTDVVRAVAVAPGEALRVDFGSGRVQPEWTGRVVSRSGEPLGRGHVHLRHAATGSLLSFTTAPDGSFAERLPAGRYDQVRWVLPGHRMRTAVVLEPIEVSARGTTADLVVHGARLSGNVLGRGAGLAPFVHARPEAAQVQRPTRTVRPSEDGAFALDGLTPGRWIVWAQAGQGAAAVSGERVVVVVAPDDVELHQDLRLSP